MNELTGTIGFDKVPIYGSVAAQKAKKPSGFKCGMKGSIDLTSGTAHFATGIGVNSGKFLTRSADQYGPNGEFITGPTPIIEGTLEVKNWGVPLPVSIDPVTKEQVYGVGSSPSAVLKYRIGTVGDAIATAVWEEYVELTLTKAEWEPVSRGLGIWTWFVENV
jgi:hypothetical protein